VRSVGRAVVPDEARLRTLVMERGAEAGVTISDDQAGRMVAYLSVLALWNRKINLTAFDLLRPTAGAIDRLVVESFAAASLVRADDRRGLDIGSGGGSPAIPLMVAVPGLEMVLVEARERKAAFLREALRTVGVSGSVETGLVQRVASGGTYQPFDLVTFRAVRADEDLWAAVDWLLKKSGRVLQFGVIGQEANTIGLVEFGRIGAATALDRRP